MCGIAGWIDWQHATGSADTLSTMTDAIVHRGPDSYGFFEKEGAHLGHRRLKIIDLQTGDQPMSNEDRTVWTVFNGEIYNFQELRRDLVRRGHRFETRSDTECIVHLYEEYGDTFVDKLRGQFAIAIWDTRQSRLLLVRDRMGQKPLYYVDLGTTIVFASELVSLLCHPNVDRQIDPVALDAYFSFKYVPDPLTIFQGIRKLSPAHQLIADSMGVSCRRYWSVDFSAKTLRSEPEAIERLDEVLSEAVRLRMIADVPLGAFLSGGVDSSLIVSYMARHASAPIKTFTIGFEESDHDERRYAREVARRFQTDHHEMIVQPDAAAVLPEMIRVFGEPFADSSALPSYYVAKMAKTDVTVAMNGDGGDESFAGYRRYASFTSAARFKQLPVLLQRVLLSSAAWIPLARASRFRAWAPFLSQSLGKLYQQSTSTTSSLRTPLYSTDLNREVDVAQRDWAADIIDRHPGLHPMDQVMLADQATYLPGDLLVKADRMTMQHSLEGRSPLLDHRVVELAATMPATLKHRRGVSKYLLKQLLLRHFSAPFVHRRKMGFGVPIACWLRSELRPLIEDCIHDSRLAADGLLNQSFMEEVLTNHQSHTRDHSVILWMLLCVEIWYRSVFLYYTPVAK